MVHSILKRQAQAMPKFRKRNPRILDFTTPQRWISSVGANLNIINPHQGANPHGNCEACAIHAAMVLTTSNTVPATIGNVLASADAHHKPIATVEEEDDRAEEVWDVLIRNAVPNGVYVLSDEDHVFNMLRDGEGRLFLVDSNQQIYKWVQSLADCAVLVDEEDNEPSNHLGPGEGEMDIYYFGQLHKRWR